MIDWINRNEALHILTIEDPVEFVHESRKSLIWHREVELHTNSAVKTVERVLGMYSPEEQESVRRSLSESLLGVIAQGLIKTTDAKRAAYHDILINTDACKDYIQRGALDEVEDIMERSGFDGMVTTNQSLLALVEAGRIDGDQAVAVSLKPNELAQALRGRS